jgi:hypothetical protein
MKTNRVQKALNGCGNDGQAIADICGCYGQAARTIPRDRQQDMVTGAKNCPFFG